MSGYRVLSIQEATPMLLDRSITPVFAFDTEWHIETGKLRGTSMAGGTPERGFFGCFWSFEQPYQQMPWETYFRTVALPLFGDPQRTAVAHPLNVDMKQYRKRGLTDALTRCAVEDTVAQAFIYDDNLPHGLKELAYCILLQTKATTHAATQREIEALRKEAKPLIKEHVEKVWEHYHQHRQKSPEVEVKIDPTWPGWQRLAMSLPPGLIKNTSAKTGRQGVVDLVKEQVAKVIQADFDRRAFERFALYGAEDAIYTLMLRYRFVPTFTAMQREHLALETEITHPIVTEMEEKGLKIDIPLLEDIATAMRAAFAALEADVVALWTLKGDTEPFNWNSNDKIANRLWNDWKLNPPAWCKNRDGSIKPKHRRAKDGLCKADALILEEMVKQYEGTPFGVAIAKLLDLRGWEKLIGTYVEPILAMAKADPEGRVHSSFWPTGARSGRFSSSDPNVENIPRAMTMPTIPVAYALKLFGLSDPANPPRGFVVVKPKKDKVTGVEGPIKEWRVRSLRQIFIPAKGFVLISADQSQIENRFTAFESRDPTMLDLYRRWDCAECKQTGLSNVILHKCPNCGAAEGKRDKSKADQPCVKGFVHGRDIHSATAAYLGFFEKYGAEGRQCVSLDTLVVTDTGLRRVGEFVGPDVGVFVPVKGQTLAADGSMVPIQGAVRTGSKPTVLVVSSRGILRCSADHRVESAGRLVRAASLEVGAPLPRAPIPAKWVGHERSVRVQLFGDGTKKVMGPDVAPDGVCEMRLGPEWGYVAGLIAGDGSSVHGTFNITVGAGDEYAAWRASVIAACQAVGLPTSLTITDAHRAGVRLGSKRVGRFLRQLELSDAKTKRLAIPWWVLRGSEQVAWAYLAGLLDTDGTITPKGPASITNKHPEFVAELALMARCLGVPVGVEPCFNKRYQRWYFRLHFLASGLLRIAANAPMRSEKLEALRRRVTRIRYPDRDTRDVVRLVLRVSEVGSSARGSAASPLYVAHEDPVETGDLEVAEPHLYVPGGLITHNSAKPVNHAATYGMGANTFMRREGGTIQEAEAHLRGWHRTYPYIRGDLDRAMPGTLHARVTEDIQERGEVSMFDGHLRRFQAQRLLLRSGNFRPYEWEGTIREGVNVKMQGGTGIGMKRAMRAIRKEIIKRGWQHLAFLINQVHDELLYEVHESIAKEFFAIVCHEMEVAFPELDVPILAEGGTSSSNWESAHA